MYKIATNSNGTAALESAAFPAKPVVSAAIGAIGSAAEAVGAKSRQLCAALACRRASAPAREQGGGQSHILEIVVGILIVVVLGIFLYLTTVPEVKDLINDAMSTIGTIKPN